MYRFGAIISFLFIIHSASAQTSYWSKQDVKTTKNAALTRNVEAFSSFHLQLDAFIASMPSKKDTESKTISLPSADNQIVDYLIWDAPIMQEELAAKYPNIRTFLIQNKDNPTEHGRLSITSQGVKAYITSTEQPYYISPNEIGKSTYAVFKTANRIHQNNFECIMKHDDTLQPFLNKRTVRSIGETLRIYRLAVATTGEYADFHGGNRTSVLEAIVETINLVNVSYEQDFAVRFILINDNDQLINLDAGKDPYDNNNAVQMLSTNPDFINGRVGANSYDIGHVFATGGAGLASLRSVCTNRKAQGATGIFPPEGSTFSIDYVAHELGHQLGSNHTFNNCQGQEVPSVAFEPGSGSTIMAYAGICGPNNVQQRTDAYFHVSSLIQITSWLDDQGGDCAEETSTNNNAPTVDAGQGGFFIPVGTPFFLTAEGSDIDEDEITYCWEQFNTGLQSDLGSPRGNAPSFRSIKPSQKPTRYFPGVSTVVSGRKSLTEVLSLEPRGYTFQCTVRDNKPGGGAASWDDISFQSTDEAGPFVITSQNEPGVIWETNRQATVTWDVANTDQAPVNCQKVNIIMSRNLGISFDIMLAENVDNDGSASFIVPDEAKSNFARVQIVAADHVFFQVNTTVFKVVEGVTATRDLVFENSISIHPNPSRGIINLQMDASTNQETKVEVLNVQGQKFQEFSFNQSSQALNLNVSAGLYFLKISRDDKVAYKKVVIAQ